MTTSMRTREEVQDALQDALSDPQPEQGEWGLGWDTGYAAALQWVLKSEPWTVAQ